MKKSFALNSTALTLALLLIFSSVALAGCKNTSESESSKSTTINVIKGTITVKNYGDIEFVLIPEVAPITVENFINLVDEKFYDGLTFHRIIDGFMIQGGDPKGDGTGGSNKNIKGEFSDNGVNNPIKHQRGVMSMARSQDPDSASSQFFIMHKDTDYLDGQYAAFGMVTKGMDVVDKIVKDAKPTDSNGTIPKDEQPVIEKITISKE